MTTAIKKIIRWSGYSAIVAGVLLNAAELVEAGFVQGSAGVLTLPERIAATLFFTGAIALLIGLVGFYLHQAEEAGSFGAAAFVIALVGSALMISSDWNELFAGPALLQIPNFSTDTFPPSLIAGFLTNYGTYLLGWILFGVASYRARVFPRSAALLLVAGMLLSITAIPGIFVLFYSTLIWLGITMLRQPQVALRPAQTVV